VNLKLERTWCGPKCTIGKLSVNGKFEVFTLEDVVRKEKVPGETAIPAGTYKVKLTRSQRFGRILPLIENVPGFDGVRIHPGNNAEDTEGCILVGEAGGPDYISRSRSAFKRLFAKMQVAAEASEPITLEIV
jgi:hypothetical protein